MASQRDDKNRDAVSPVRVFFHELVRYHLRMMDRAAERPAFDMPAVFYDVDVESIPIASVGEEDSRVIFVHQEYHGYRVFPGSKIAAVAM